jgi:hypothetical protein
MSIDTILSWGFFGLAGIVIALVLVRLRPQRRALKRMESLPHYAGPAIAARIRIRERFVYLWIAGVFIVFGILQVIPHERHDLVGWLGTIAAFSIPVRMIWAILEADRDTDEAMQVHTPKL